MPLPQEVLDMFFRDYMDEKTEAVRENRGPASLGPRFILDFGTDYQTWPWFDIVQAQAAGFTAEQMPNDKNARLLAVLDLPNDHDEITLVMAKTMSLLGPPQWAAVYNDAYRMKLDEATDAGVLERGDIERLFYETVNPKITELLTMVAVHADGETCIMEVTFKYDDRGKVVFDDIEINHSIPLVGWMTTLLRLMVSLSGRHPIEIMEELNTVYRRN